VLEHAWAYDEAYSMSAVAYISARRLKICSASTNAQIIFQSPDKSQPLTEMITGNINKNNVSRE
jgi:hypothetical protein